MPIGLLAIILSSLFAGAGIYISCVEHPARFHLEDQQLLVQWVPSYKRGIVMQGTLAVLSGCLGLIAFWKNGNWSCLAGGILMLANWPYTVIAILPVNKSLLATPFQRADVLTRATLKKWGYLHSVRAGLGVFATAAYFWGCLTT